MTEILERELEALVPLRAEAVGDWEEVARRASAERRAAKPRRLAVALVAAALMLGAVAVATPVGAVVARTLGDFSAWLHGAPGKPASQAEQSAFERAHRSWLGFPHGVELRRLVDVRRGGSTFRLYGYRLGDSLCLRVVVSGVAKGSTSSCAPRSELMRRRQPALPMMVDVTVGVVQHRHVRIGPETFMPSQARVDAGIVADGVRTVRLRSTDGREPVWLNANAYLGVAIRPSVGARLRSVVAVDAHHRAVEIPFSASQSLFGSGTPTHLRPTGPRRIERRVRSGDIGWLERHELRGEPVPRGRLPRYFHHRFSRMIQPDPGDPARMLVGILRRGKLVVVCTALVEGGGAGGGCLRPLEVFRRTPISVSGGSSGASQYDTVAGLVSDDVASLRVFLATSEVESVALRDNVFLVHVNRAKVPARIVAYDRQGRVIGIEKWGDWYAYVAPQPRPGAHWRTILRRSAGRTKAFAMVVAGTQRTRCLWISSGTGSSEGCYSVGRWRGPKLQLGSSSGGGRAAVYGQVAPDVALVRLTVGRRTLRIVPTEGVVLVLLPHEQKPPRFSVVGFDSRGRLVGRESSPPRPHA
jgi:hypothetical protein